MIIDEVRVNLRAGKGGSGSNSFFRRAAGRAVPWGGDGAKGGDIIIFGSRHLYDLSRLKGKKELRAQDGTPGGSRKRSGRKGEDLVVEVPVGTLVRDAEGNVLSDIAKEGKQFLAARGGEGGKGNYRGGVATEGDDGENVRVLLDYRIPADVALIGVPNCGRTSLLNTITGNQYRVADYPFTTTSCVWGEFEYKFRRIKVLDLPAIIAGSSQGRGVGNRFLKHLYRTKIVLFVTDNYSSYCKDYDMLKREVAGFDSSLLEGKKIFYLLTKTDKIVNRRYPEEVIPVSCAIPESIENFKRFLVREIRHAAGGNKDRQ